MKYLHSSIHLHLFTLLSTSSFIIFINIHLPSSIHLFYIYHPSIYLFIHHIYQCSFSFIVIHLFIYIFSSFYLLLYSSYLSIFIYIHLHSFIHSSIYFFIHHIYQYSSLLIFIHLFKYQFIHSCTNLFKSQNLTIFVCKKLRTNIPNIYFNKTYLQGYI